MQPSEQNFLSERDSGGNCLPHKVQNRGVSFFTASLSAFPRESRAASLHSREQKCDLTLFAAYCFPHWSHSLRIGTRRPGTKIQDSRNQRSFSSCLRERWRSRPRPDSAPNVGDSSPAPYNCESSTWRRYELSMGRRCRSGRIVEPPEPPAVSGRPWPGGCWVRTTAHSTGGCRTCAASGSKSRGRNDDSPRQPPSGEGSSPVRGPSAPRLRVLFPPSCRSSTASSQSRTWRGSNVPRYRRSPTLSWRQRPI